MKPIEWLTDRLRLLDQTRLPLDETYLEITDYRQVVSAIKELKVRGAPAIGIAAAYGIALGSLNLHTDHKDVFLSQLESIIDDFAQSRPTAVNLFYAIKRMSDAAATGRDVSEIKRLLVEEAASINRQEEKAMADLSANGARLLKDGCRVLTHCNTGQLATGVSYGTGLGVIKAAAEQGKKVTVYVDETRPLLQGARLNTWELEILGIPYRLITDNMAGYFLSRGEIDCAIVGADRIAFNGDTANKIGTYSVAVLARENSVPFYVAAPVSTIDSTIRTGKDIPIEQRNPEEVVQIRGVRIAAPGSIALNPAFDVTPNKYISAIITEKGIIEKPYSRNIKHTLREER
jgi:methylthioribose-1-phosphate isomerase